MGNKNSIQDSFPEELSHDDIVIIKTYDNHLEAQVAASSLEASDISYFLTEPSVEISNIGIKLYIRKNDMEIGKKELAKIPKKEKTIARDVRTMRGNNPLGILIYAFIITIIFCILMLLFYR